MSRLKRLVSFRVSPIFGRMVPFKVGLALVWAWGATNALASPPPITPRDVDFTGNHPMRNVEGMFPDPEVDHGIFGTESAPAISINLDGELRVKFEHHNASSHSGIGTFTLHTAKLVIGDDEVHLNVWGDPFPSSPVSIPAHSNFWSPEYQLTGWWPFIHAGELVLGYTIDVSNIPGMSTGYGMFRNIRFLVNLEPPVAHMAIVWHELLEETTAYAWGKANDSDAAREVTSGLFSGGRFAYPAPPYKGYFILNLEPDSNKEPRIVFELTRFLREGGQGVGNCYDVALYLLLLFQTQGLLGEPIWRICETGLYHSGLFVSNLICPIGLNPNHGSSYSAVIWSNHAVVFFNNLVYDACLALERAPDLSVYQRPPAGWTPEDHWYKSHGAEFTGIAKRFLTPAEHVSGSINPGLPHQLTRPIDEPFPFVGIQ